MTLASLSCDGGEEGCDALCGNGVVECDETCDDGNLEDGDGCSGRCTLEECADGDGDGYPDAACGGEDCDDADPDVNPGVSEVPCNSTDDDCDPSTIDGVDSDGDGWTGCGGDCDDTDPDVNPDAAEVCANGEDDDCDDLTPDLFDGDSDGDACDVDCNDADPDVGPSRSEVPCNGTDDDCDAVTADGTDGDGDTVIDCDDCDDENPDVHPGADEICDNGVDDDCDDLTLDLFDGDSDGDACDVDCNDANPDVGPSRTEIPCNSVDDDCDPVTIDGVDMDADGWTECGGDCDDGNPDVNPDADEVCANGEDDDCSAATPDVFDGDADGDACDVDCNDANPDVGPSRTEILCNSVDDDCDPATIDGTDGDGDGWTECGGDCDDGNPDVNPGADEACGNGTDDDCDALTPDVFDGDADGDACDVDCNDADPDVGPSRTEIPCNSTDDDCDPATIDGTDGDGDGWSECGGDCDDGNPDVNPGADEVCGNGTDDDCDAMTPDVFDGDSDGDSCAVDCDDANPAIGPSRTEIPCNGRDEDCSPLTPDVPDDDFDGWTLCSGDCDDQDPLVNPGQVEACANGTDDDCDALTPDLFDGDSDGDACDVDCNDANPDVGPSRAEVCDSLTDDDCDGAPDCLDSDCTSSVLCLGGDCTNPIDITGSGLYVAETSGLADAHSGSCQGADGGEVVYRLTLTEISDVHLDTQTSDYDTVLYVRASSCTAGTETACNDEVGPNDSWSRLEIIGLAPGVYFIFVDSALPDDGGTMGLNVAVVSTTPRTPLPVTQDPLVRMPGTQSDDGVALEAPNRCMNCHSGYDPAVEPGTHWKGSMMAQAARDFIFWATMTVAAQDSLWALGRPNATDLCERCHFPSGWLAGRSDPTNASAMTGADFDGVHCDACHRQYNPFFETLHDGTREGSDWTAYWDETNASATPSQAAADATLAQDRLTSTAVTFYNGSAFFGADHEPVPAGYTENGAGQYYMDPLSDKRASFADATARHPMLYSRFHKSKYFCETCHDVSNPALANLAFDGTPPGDGTTVLPSEQNPPHGYYHVERTFSEFMLSAYGLPGGSAGLGPYDPSLFETSLANNYIARCQDCHMNDGVGKGCDKNDAPLRPTGSTEHPQSGQPVHDMTGGNMFVSTVLASSVAGSPNFDPVNRDLLGQGPAVLTLDMAAGLGVDPLAMLDGVSRAQQQLTNAAAVQNVAYNPSTGALSFRVQNQTGHKLISGFPEGRRMFVNVKVFSGATLIYEVNPYDPVVGTLKGLPADYSPSSPVLGANEEYRDELVYEMHPTSSLTGETGTFHFVLATDRYKDNRIPPKGFRIAEADARISVPVWHGAPSPAYFTAAEYAGGYDDVSFTVVPGADMVEVNLYYQTTSREFIEFLRDEINGVGTTLTSPTPAGAAVAYTALRDPFFDGLRAWGDTMWQLWDHNKTVPGAAPVLMTDALWTP